MDADNRAEDVRCCRSVEGPAGAEAEAVCGAEK